MFEFVLFIPRWWRCCCAAAASSTCVGSSSRDSKIELEPRTERSHFSVVSCSAVFTLARAVSEGASRQDEHGVFMCERCSCIRHLPTTTTTTTFVCCCWGECAIAASDCLLRRIRRPELCALSKSIFAVLRRSLGPTIGQSVGSPWPNVF